MHMMMIGEARLRVTAAGQGAEMLNLEICRMGQGMVDNTTMAREQAKALSRALGFTFTADPDAGQLVLVIAQLPVYLDPDSK